MVPKCEDNENQAPRRNTDSLKNKIKGALLKAENVKSTFISMTPVPRFLHLNVNKFRNETFYIVNINMHSSCIELVYIQLKLGCILRIT